MAENLPTLNELAKMALDFARGAEVRSWPPGFKMRDDLIAACKRIMQAEPDTKPAVHRPVRGGAAAVKKSWQCSGCGWAFPGPWKKVCPACYREDYWTGSVSPDAAIWPPAIRDAMGDDFAPTEYHCGGCGVRLSVRTVANGNDCAACGHNLPLTAPPSTEERTERRCDALRGMEPWQPTCDLPAGHAGPHRWEGPATGAAAPSPRQEPGACECGHAHVGPCAVRGCMCPHQPAPRQEPGGQHSHGCWSHEGKPCNCLPAPRQEQEACPSCHGYASWVERKTGGTVPRLPRHRPPPRAGRRRWDVICLDTASNFHWPYECGVGCIHCEQKRTPDHDPDKCWLCHDGPPPGLCRCGGSGVVDSGRPSDASADENVMVPCPDCQTSGGRDGK